MMATGGGSGKLFELVGEPMEENTRLGQAFVLFGLLSVVGGVGLFVLTEAFAFEEGAFLTYRRVAVGLAGYGLPAFLHGVVLVSGGHSRAGEVGVIGVVLSALAVFAFFAAYPEGWSLAAEPRYVIGTLAVYVLGAMLGSFAAGGAMLASRESDDDSAEETGFIWGDPPEI
jgi:hypothetical protein